jgi:hypothetical protein
MDYITLDEGVAYLAQHYKTILNENISLEI